MKLQLTINFYKEQKSHNKQNEKKKKNVESQ